MIFVIPFTRSRVWQATQNPYASGPPALIRSAWENAARIPIRAPRNAGCLDRRETRVFIDIVSGKDDIEVHNYCENNRIKVIICYLVPI
jgi:hypothetical protein